MAHQIQEADNVPSPSSQSVGADAFQGERDHLQALRRRLEAAAEALARVRDQLQARAAECQGRDEDRELIGTEAGSFDPEGGGKQ